MFCANLMFHRCRLPILNSEAEIYEFALFLFQENSYKQICNLPDHNVGDHDDPLPSCDICNHSDKILGHKILKMVFVL